jgi:hypothetical protein
LICNPNQPRRNRRARLPATMRVIFIGTPLLCL